VSQANRVGHAGALELLTEHFARWREAKQLALKELAQQLRPDDPLLCPISLFGTMDRGRLERAHTITLAWLLDPRQAHGYSSHLLQALLLSLIDCPLPESIQAELVEADHAVPGGLLDIWAKGIWTTRNGERQSWSLAVECKIDDEEADGQLSRYDRYLDNWEQEAGLLLRVFITPEGRPATTSNKWCHLSFESLACALHNVWRHVESSERQFLRYYLAGVLRDVCQWPVPLSLNGSIADPHAVVRYLRRIVSHEGVTGAATR
jgi:hypothetical protein